MLWVGLAVVVGLVLLAVAPDRFVAGSAGLAERWGVSRVVIGAVVVGFGTSSPELLVSGLAAADGQPEVGVGNVIGSNMANLSLVVGVAALVGTLGTPDALLRGELPLMVGATVLFAAVVQNGLTRWEGALLGATLVAVLTAVIRRARVPQVPEPALATDVDGILRREVGHGPGRLVADTVAGLAGTLLGAQLLVVGAVEIASELDLSGGFVGVTVVALGTSLPELVTAVAASRAGEDQLIIGNVVGSNLFNCLAVGALVGLVGPSPLHDAGLTVGAVALMLAITVLATVALATHRAVRRHEAVGLLVVYLAMLPLLA